MRVPLACHWRNTTTRAKLESDDFDIVVSHRNQRCEMWMYDPNANSYSERRQRKKNSVKKTVIKTRREKQMPFIQVDLNSVVAKRSYLYPFAQMFFWRLHTLTHTLKHHRKSHQAITIIIPSKISTTTIAGAIYTVNVHSSVSVLFAYAFFLWIACSRLISLTSTCLWMWCYVMCVCVRVCRSMQNTHPYVLAVHVFV